jgi:hypothetical protein
LHKSVAIPLGASPIRSMAVRMAAAAQSIPIKPIPYTPSAQPEFELLVHPDYRPAPPRPDTLNNAYVFSVMDQLPTQTERLYDLIFSVRRRHYADVHRTLQYLHIEVPVSRGSRALDLQDLDGFGHRPREPLLVAGADAQAGASIAANPRFVPALFNGPASRIGDGRWDGLDVLLITLTPRSGSETGTLALLADGKSAAVAVRLTESVLESVVTPETINVYKKGSDGKVVKSTVQGCARVPIRLTEVYGNDFPMQWSWCMAVKADVGDLAVDLQ